MTQDFAKRKASPTSEKASAKTQKKSPKKATSTGSKRKVNSRKPAPKPNARKRPPFWAWIITGVCAAGFVAFLSKLSQKPTSTSTTVPAPQKEDVVAPKEQQSQVKFDFYQILKEHEVDVGDKVAAATPKQENIHYFLQVASFRSPAEADTQRAKILLLGLPANVEKTNDKEGNPWYRIVAGPFETRSKLAKARSILASEQINSFLIKRKIKP